MTKGKIGLVVLSIVTAIGWAPVASVMFAGTFASAFGCALDEGNRHPCIVAGVDWGDLLYTLGVAGWFMLLTWPLILLTFVVWIALAIVYVVRRREARQART